MAWREKHADRFKAHYILSITCNEDGSHTPSIVNPIHITSGNVLLELQIYKLGGKEAAAYPLLPQHIPKINNIP